MNISFEPYVSVADAKDQNTSKILLFSRIFISRLPPHGLIDCLRKESQLSHVNPIIIIMHRRIILSANTNLWTLIPTLTPALLRGSSDSSPGRHLNTLSRLGFISCSQDPFLTPYSLPQGFCLITSILTPIIATGIAFTLWLRREEKINTCQQSVCFCLRGRNLARDRLSNLTVRKNLQFEKSHFCLIGELARVTGKWGKQTLMAGKTCWGKPG